jgi:hypothetical protein
MRIKRILGEPMLHFVLIGLALFAIYHRLSPYQPGDSRIVISQGVVDDLISQHVAVRGRPPSDRELRQAIDTYVREEILYREGAALGLDRDDAVVKRRVRQKLEVMAEENASSAAPTDAELTAYLAANKNKFMQPAMLTFEQIFVGHASSSPEIRLVAARVRDAVERGDNPERFGTASLLPQGMTNVPADLLARNFGDEFATALEQAPLGKWIGPIEGSFGSHFAKVTARTASWLPKLDDVRDKVVREWENERRQRARDQEYAKMRAKYQIDVEAQVPQGVRP